MLVFFFSRLNVGASTKDVATIKCGLNPKISIRWALLGIRLAGNTWISYPDEANRVEIV